MLSDSPSAIWMCPISCCHRRDCLRWCSPCTPRSIPFSLSFSSPLLPSLPVFWLSSPQASPELSTSPSVFSCPPSPWPRGPRDQTPSYQTTPANWSDASLCLWRRSLCLCHSSLPPCPCSSSFALGFSPLFCPCPCCCSCASLRLCPAPSSACLGQDFSSSSSLCRYFHRGSQSCAGTFPFSPLQIFQPGSPFPSASSSLWNHLNQSWDRQRSTETRFTTFVDQLQRPVNMQRIMLMLKHHYVEVNTNSRSVTVCQTWCRCQQSEFNLFVPQMEKCLHHSSQRRVVL